MLGLSKWIDLEGREVGLGAPDTWRCPFLPKVVVAMLHTAQCGVCERQRLDTRSPTARCASCPLAPVCPWRAEAFLLVRQPLHTSLPGLAAPCLPFWSPGWSWASACSPPQGSHAGLVWLDPLGPPPAHTRALPYCTRSCRLHWRALCTAPTLSFSPQLHHLPLLCLPGQEAHHLWTVSSMGRCLGCEWS